MTAYKAPMPTPAPTNSNQNQLSENEVRMNVRALLQAEEHLHVHRSASPYVFKEFYKEEGRDLEAEYAKRPKTRHGEEIKARFAAGDEKGPLSQLAEMLPMFANAPGRLGDYIEASVIKTAKPDDEGNTFVDLIIEIKNTWLSEKDAPKEARDLPAKMTFLVDVTTAWGEKLEDKKKWLKDEYLVRAKESEALCYKDSLGKLGIVRPKLLVAQTPHFLEDVGGNLGALLHQNASDSFSITNPSKFDEQYRLYFLDLMQHIRQNAEDNINYLESLVPDAQRKALADKYKKIAAFARMYEATPTKKKRI